MHLLNRVDFDAIVDHLALTHIIKSKSRTGYNWNKKAVRSDFDAKKSSQRNAFTCYCRRNTGRIFNQPIF